MVALVGLLLPLLVRGFGIRAELVVFRACFLFQALEFGFGLGGEFLCVLRGAVGGALGLECSFISLFFCLLLIGVAGEVRLVRAGEVGGIDAVDAAVAVFDLGDRVGDSGGNG